MTKRLKSKGHSEEDIRRYIMIKEMQNNRKNLKEGQKVKLNIDKLRSDPDWPDKQPSYKEWVKTHAEETFTVEYDENHANNPTVVCLKECNDSIKWLFWEGDLEVVEDDSHDGTKTV